MALEIKGLKRVFKLKKGNNTLKLDDPNPDMLPVRGDGFLFHNLSRADHRHTAWPPHRGRLRGL